MPLLIKAPSSPNFPPEVPPLNTITFLIKASRYEFVREGHKHSFYSIRFFTHGQLVIIWGFVGHTLSIQLHNIATLA